MRAFDDITDWDLLLGLPPYPELSALPFVSEWLVGPVYRLGPCAYALAGASPSEEADPGRGVVVAFLWAPDVAMVNRFVLRKHTPVSRPEVCPPRNLLISPEATTFGTVRNLAASDKYGPWAIFQLPDSRRQGQFVGKWLSVARFNYCFLCEGESLDEPICAVEIVTSSTRWQEDT